jgi:hypothetical protein
MRVLGRAFLALLVATGLFAQYHGGFSGAAPRLTGSFGSVVFPGGTSATTGVQRSFGSVVFPGGGGPQLIVPNSFTGVGLRGGTLGRGRSSGLVYAYPVYVGGYYDGSYLYPADQSAAQVPPAQNVTVVYPPVPAPAPAPAMIYPSGGGDAQTPGVRLYQPAPGAADEESAAPPEQPYYLLAFKDHTIYSTPAYWVDGDTIHYFTAGNKHNQASVSLIDRELTLRLNRESGAEVKLPAEK